MICTPYTTSPQGWTRSTFSIASICTRSRRIPASASTNLGLGKDDLICSGGWWNVGYVQHKEWQGEWHWRSQGGSIQSKGAHTPAMSGPLSITRLVLSRGELVFKDHRVDETPNTRLEGSLGLVSKVIKKKRRMIAARAHTACAYRQQPAGVHHHHPALSE